MIKAWAADVTPLYDRECYERYHAMAPDFRKEKADRLRLHEMKAQSIGVWTLWEKIREHYDLPEEAPHNFHIQVHWSCVRSVWKVTMFRWAVTWKWKESSG